jgi:flagellar hook-length control protein FliK
VLLIPSEARLAAVANASNLAGNSSAVGSTEASKIQADSMVGGLNSLIAAAPALSNGLVDASGSTANTQAVSTPALGLAANAPKDFDPTPAKSKATPAGNNMPLAADPQAVTAPSDVADKGLSDPSFGQALVADTVPFAGTGTLALPAGATMQQPGSVSTPSVPASTVSVILLPEVGSNEWGKALSQQVIQLSTGDRQIAEIQLNPPGLGPLKVTLSVSDQQMQAAFVSAHSSVRAAVETALPQLRALLAESGISLGQTSVGAESQPQTAFASGQGSFANQSPRQGYSDRDAGMVAPLSSQSTAVKLRPGQGLRIDTYA